MIDQKDFINESEFSIQNSVISSIVGWSWGVFFGTNQFEPTTVSRDLVHLKSAQVSILIGVR